MEHGRTGACRVERLWPLGRSCVRATALRPCLMDRHWPLRVARPIPPARRDRPDRSRRGAAPTRGGAQALGPQSRPCPLPASIGIRLLIPPEGGINPAWQRPSPAEQRVLLAPACPADAEQRRREPKRRSRGRPMRHGRQTRTCLGVAAGVTPLPHPDARGAAGRNGTAAKHVHCAAGQGRPDQGVLGFTGRRFDDIGLFALTVAARSFQAHAGLPRSAQVVVDGRGRAHTAWRLYL